MVVSDSEAICSFLQMVMRLIMKVCGCVTVGTFNKIFCYWSTMNDDDGDDDEI